MEGKATPSSRLGIAARRPCQRSHFALPDRPAIKCMPAMLPPRFGSLVGTARCPVRRCQTRSRIEITKSIRSARRDPEEHADFCRHLFIGSSPSRWKLRFCLGIRSLAAEKAPSRSDSLLRRPHLFVGLHGKYAHFLQAPGDDKNPGPYGRCNVAFGAGPFF